MQRTQVQQTMMRKGLAIGLMLAAWMEAAAARRVSVTQLEQMLAADAAVHRADADVARQAGDLEMTERLTGSTLQRMAAERQLGPRSALALQLLADQSAFLDPPANELPATAAPDADAQEHLMAAARAYAGQTWTRMPNFYVTRVTNRFDDGPHVLKQGDWPAYVGLYLSGSTKHEVTFRDGKEAPEVESVATGKTPPAQELGLRSWGEFGPALVVVLNDAAREKVTFSHWEQTANGIAAVFRYAVPRDASHYAVNYGYQAETVIGRTQFGYSGSNRTPQQMANIPREQTYRTFSENPAYHGTIAIDPANGAVMRLTIEAELSSVDPLLMARTMVEYGPVAIGERRFICPVRSVALSREQVPVAKDSMGASASKTMLLINETEFVEYHRLGSTTRIVTEKAESAVGAGSESQEAAGRETTPIGQAHNTASEPESVAKAPATGPGSTPTAVEPLTENAMIAPVAPAASAGTPSPAAPVVPEISMAEARGLPEAPAREGQSGDGFSLKVTSRLVNVGLVAYDKKGHTVTDLQAADLELYDNGKKQEIRAFSVPAAMQANGAASGGPEVAPAETAGLATTYANRVSEAQASATATAAGAGATILLIDESHIAWADMSNARQQILKFLGSLKAGERVGLYSMNGLGFRVLQEVTADPNVLIARMQKFMPSAQSAAHAQDEETRNRQHFDEVHNAADLNTVNGNHTDVPDFASPIDPQLMQMGADPTRASFVILTQVARHLSAIAGQKKLVWVSSDNVFADWRDQSVGIEKSPKPMEAVTLHAQEALNEAHVAIYPFDVSQLEAAGVSADLQHQNVQLTQAASDVAGLGGGAATSRSIGPGRIDAAMSQDLHPVQGPVRQVAAATGGKVIRRAGDLAGALSGIVADEHATYMLSFTPAGEADGQYHTINVKTSKRGVSLSYRTGYVFDKDAETLQERFQQAVWRPMDVTEIAVKADVAPGEGGSNVKLTISAGDLGLEEQAGRWMDKLDIFFIQRDDAGLHAQLEGQTLGLRLKSETYQRLVPSGVPFERFVMLKPGVASLRVLVVDENTGHMGSVTIPVAPRQGGA